MVYRDYIEFIADGSRPYWKVKEYVEYLETMHVRDAGEYFAMTREWIEDKGENTYDRDFVTRIRGIKRQDKERLSNLKIKDTAKELELYKDDLHQWKDKYVLEPEKEYCEVPDGLLLNVFSCFFGHNKLWRREKDIVNHRPKIKIKEGVDPLQMIIDFYEIFHWKPIGNNTDPKKKGKVNFKLYEYYTHEGASAFLIDFDLGVNRKTIVQYLRRKERRG